MDSLAYHNPDFVAPVDEDEADEYEPSEIIAVLRSYADEAETARLSGPNSRDIVWQANWDRYWGRYRRSDKADWQSQHVMPEVPMYVDRWAAAMREALDRSGSGWFTVLDGAGNVSQLQVHIQKTMKCLLSRCSRTPDGHPTDFSGFFEDQMKLGAMMACCASVTWEDDKDYSGWVRVDAVDPREVWYDAKGRNLYRRRLYEIDHYELMALAREFDEDLEEPLYDQDEIMDLMAEEDEKLRDWRQTSTGTGEGTGSTSKRKPIKMEEWLCTVIMDDGNVAATDSLIIVANDKHLIRGPEPNPFWHNRDWIVFCPMVSVPLSIYGRTYMEDWTDVADAFIELTQLILDGCFTSTIKSFIANPELLDDPTQLSEGISPNKLFTTSEDIENLARFIHTIDLGELPASAFQVWTALKNELREGAKLSEIALGQTAPNSRTTATEIRQVQQSGSAMIRSMARTIEARLVEPLLDLVWKTALQHMDFREIGEVIGFETAAMLNERREDFLESSISFQVRGISGIVDRQQKLQNLVTAISMIGRNQVLAAQLFQEVSPKKLVDQLFSLFGLDMSELRPDETEALVDMITQAQPGAAAQGQQTQNGGRPAPPGTELT